MIPNICGLRLPCLYTLEIKSDKEIYAQIVLILLKPFRNKEDLLKNNLKKRAPWWMSYLNTNFSYSSKKAINNLNDYHNCRIRAASKYFAKDNNSIRSNTQDEEFELF